MNDENKDEDALTSWLQDVIHEVDTYATRRYWMTTALYHRVKTNRKATYIFSELDQHGVIRTPEILLLSNMIGWASRD
jgi:hypothetical protein